MKIRSTVLALVLAATAPIAAAQQKPQSALPMDLGVGTQAFPPGVTLVQIFRWYNPNTTDRFTGRELPWNWEYLGWRLEGTLGFISYTPFEGSRTLYQCGVNENKNQPIQDYFTSLDSNCEGHFPFTPAPIIGYIASAPIAGLNMTALYRCDTPGYAEDHFDSVALNCEGNKPGSVNEGALGYNFY